MVDDTFYGTYIRFTTNSNSEGALLTGADNLVGDELSFAFEQDEKGNDCVILSNKFGKRIGKLAPEETSHLQVLSARGWTIRMVLSLVVAAQGQDGIDYWGEVLLLCNDARNNDAFDVFATNVKTMLQEGIRPNIDLGTQGINQVIKSNGNWKPTQRAPKPKLNKKEVILKDKLSAKEKLIEDGRKGNRGCFFVSVVFDAVVIFGIVALLAHFVFHLF